MNKLPLNQILCGPCEELLQGFPTNSIDLAVTDPQYGLGFMGLDWDQALPSREAFKEICRVLKPGALAFVMSSPRQDLMARMILLLEDAGFRTDLSFIEWIYKTGFPKAYDMSLGIDTKFIREEFIEENDRKPSKDELKRLIKEKRKVIGKRNKLNSYKQGFRPPRPNLHYSHSEIIVIKKILIELFNKSGKTRSQIDLECGFRACNYLSLPKDGKKHDPWVYILPPFNKWLKIKEVIKYKHDRENPLLDKWIADAEKTLIERGDRLSSLETGYGVGFTNYEETEISDTTPFTELAKEWDGWKSQTGLKPAQEPVLMVYKPRSESTIVDNVLKWGTGAVNVDACRIPIEKWDNSAHYGGLHETPAGYSGGFSEGYRTKEKEGRFPANLLVSDGALDTGEINKSSGGSGEATLKSIDRTDIGYGFKKIDNPSGLGGYGDVGDQSRYFDLDAWAEHHGFLDVPKPDTSERDYGLKGKKAIPKSKFNLNDGSKDERFDGAILTPRRNTHPTVKPIKLMAYLIELGCPRNGVVLDPFVGSGTTCIAAKQLGRRYIGIEIKPEYHVMAEARVAAYPDPLEWFMETKT